jgi:hypothetical protein
MNRAEMEVIAANKASIPMSTLLHPLKHRSHRLLQLQRPSILLLKASPKLHLRPLQSTLELVAHSQGRPHSLHKLQARHSQLHNQEELRSPVLLRPQDQVSPL